MNGLATLPRRKNIINARLIWALYTSLNKYEVNAMKQDFLGNEWPDRCMGCAIVDQSMLPPGGFIWQGQYFDVYQDPLIPLPGFLVIAARRHIQSIAEMDASEYDEFSRLLRSSVLAIRKATGIEKLTLVQEEYSSHFHLWFFPWSPEVIEKHGKPGLAAIRAIMSTYLQKCISAEAWEGLKMTIEKIKLCMDEIQ